MSKKSFFEERTTPQIRDLRNSRTTSSLGLVDKIHALGSDEGLIIGCNIIPGRFYAGNSSSAEAARKAYKHGEYVTLPQSTTVTDALKETRLPHELRREAFETFRGRREGEINKIGYAFEPIQGRDKTKRLVPFVWIFEGARLFAYGIRNTEGIEVKPYDRAEKVAIEGANIVVSVPSREEKKARYIIRFSGIPTIDNPRKNSIWTTFQTTYAEGKMPEHELWSFKHKFVDDSEQSRTLILYPHDVAGTLAIARNFMTQNENNIPWDMNPFAKPSLSATNFYRNLCNNVLITDPQVKGKNKTRKLYVVEKSILLGRREACSAPDEIMFWKAGRDPKLHQYDWSIPGIR